jgi:hypothetical protein
VRGSGSIPRLIERLRNEARELIVKELKMSGAATEVVRKEMKAEIRAEWKRSGRDVVFIAKAMEDLREEIREWLRSELRSKVKIEQIRESEERGEKADQNLEAESVWTVYTMTAETKRR